PHKVENRNVSRWPCHPWRVAHGPCGRRTVIHMTTSDPEQPMVTTAIPAPEQLAPAGIGRRSTSQAFGAPRHTWDPLVPGGGLGRLRDVAVGAAFEAEETTAGLLADLRRATAWRRRRIAELAERGALERARGRQPKAGAGERGV